MFVDVVVVQGFVEFVVLLGVEGYFDVKAAHDILAFLPSGRVEEDSS